MQPGKENMLIFLNSLEENNSSLSTSFKGTTSREESRESHFLKKFAGGQWWRARFCYEIHPSHLFALALN